MNKEIILLLAVFLTSDIYAAERTVPEAGINGVAAYRDGDYKTAYKNMEHHVNTSDALVQPILVNLNEQGVEQEYQHEYTWYLKAAEQGSDFAQYKLGDMYGNGLGVKQNYGQAYKWYLKAAEQGNANAQYHLGLLYYNGDGVVLNKTKAKDWFGKACDNGIQDACNAYMRLSLLSLVEDMPAGWKVVTEDGDEIRIAYWDKEHYVSCSKKDSLIYGNKPVIWAPPSYSRAYYMLAYMSIEAGNTNEASTYIDKALKLEPDHPILLNEKGVMLNHLGENEEAIKSFNLVINSTGCVSNEEKSRALRGKGVSLIDLGKLDEAEKAFRDSLNIEADNEVALSELEYILLLRSGTAAGPQPGITHSR